MKREFLSNIFFLLGVNLLVKPLYLFGIDRNVQNILPPGEYGLYAQLISLAYLFQIFADFGIQNFNNRQIAQHRYLVGKYFPALVSLKAWLGILFAGLMLGVSLALGYWQANPGLVLLITGNQLLLSFLLFLRSNLSGLGKYRWDSFISVLDKLLMIVLLSGILWLGWGRSHFRLEWFVWAQSLSFAIPIGWSLYLLRHHIRSPKLRVPWSLLGAILRQTYPYALVVLLMTLYTRIDMVMVGRMLEDGNREADLYASAYRLLDAANMFGYLFATLLLPMFARQLKADGRVAELAEMGIRLIWAGAIPLAGAMIFFRTPVMEALYVGGSAYSGRILAWLMGSFLAVTGSYIYGTLLTANGSLMAMNRIFLIGVGGNILLNCLLIPAYQAEGAAMATLITQFFVFFAQVVLCLRLTRLKTNALLIGQLVLFGLATAAMNWSLQHFLNLPLLALLVISLVGGSVLALSLQILRAREALRMLSKTT